MASVALAVIEYPTTQEAIAEAKAKYADLRPNTPDGYKAVVAAIGVLRTTRTAIEKRRKDLKQESLEYGRNVDAVAKELTAMVVAIEDPLQARKQAVDDERALAKREAEHAEFVAREAKLKAEREAEEARIKAERESVAAAQKKIDEDRARLKREEAAVETQRREVADKERELAAAGAALIAQTDAKIRPLQQTELLAVQGLPPAAPRATVIPFVQPIVSQVERTHAFARQILDLADRAPKLEDPQAAAAIKWTTEKLRKLGADLMRFEPKLNNEQGA